MKRFALEEVDCPLCASGERTFWARENGFTGSKCANCGLVYVSPRPGNAAIDAATKLGAHQVEGGTLSVTYRPNWRNRRMYRGDIAKAFAPEIAVRRPISWLDVGAGYGEFVSELTAILPTGSRVIGVEPMTAKARHAQNAGLSVTDQPLATINERFDVVSIMNVFSHVPDFRTFLAEISGLVKPGGSIFLRTGNGGDIPNRAHYPDKLDFPDHLVFAGREHIRRFLSEQGFAIVWETGDRLDTLAWSAKSVIKRAMGRKSPVALPYRSQFLDMRMRAVHGAHP